MFRWCDFAAIATIAAGVNATSQSCSSFTPNIVNTTVISIAHHEISTNVSIPTTTACSGGPVILANITTNLCRVVLDVATSTSSTVRIEGFLPDEWNSRFLATGNGGIGGCIDYGTMQNGAKLGFASFGTNVGHDGEVGFDFFLNHPETINDWGHRGIHVEATVGKELVRQYYAAGSAGKSYYVGCSTGGRQGIQEARLYPEDFDGILAGSPGIDWLHIVASKGILARRIGWPALNSSAYVRPEQWPAIVEAQIKLLDSLDGVTNGIIDDPTSLRFDPNILACGTGVLNSTMCLSAEQVISVRKAYEPLANTAGQIVYPGFGIGSDTSVFSANQVNGTAQLTYRVLDDFWRGAVYNDSDWTSDNFNETDMDFALRVNPGGITDAVETDLGDYHARGGKIIAYHGRKDETITSALQEQFFTGVSRSLGLSQQETQSFYRLFFIPGMQHCARGPGAWNIGNSGVYPFDEKTLDVEHNALLALVDWVEKGHAPDHLIGTKYVNDVVGGQILAQRRHCVYPNKSRWDGTGSTTLASSWQCIAPGQ